MSNYILTIGEELPGCYVVRYGGQTWELAAPVQLRGAPLGPYFEDVTHFEFSALPVDSAPIPKRKWSTSMGLRKPQ